MKQGFYVDVLVRDMVNRVIDATDITRVNLSDETSPCALGDKFIEQICL